MFFEPTKFVQRMAAQAPHMKKDSCACAGHRETSGGVQITRGQGHWGRDAAIRGQNMLKKVKSSPSVERCAGKGGRESAGAVESR